MDWLLPLAPLLYLWAFWGLYVLVMGLYRAHLDRRLTAVTKALSAPFVLAGYTLDFLTNLTAASLVFMELPRELLVTSRLKRHLAGAGWRRRLSEWVCTYLLDPFDPTGRHCD